MPTESDTSYINITQNGTGHALYINQTGFIPKIHWSDEMTMDDEFIQDDNRTPMQKAIDEAVKELR